MRSEDNLARRIDLSEEGSEFFDRARNEEQPEEAEGLRLSELQKGIMQLEKELEEFLRKGAKEKELQTVQQDTSFTQQQDDQQTGAVNLQTIAELRKQERAKGFFVGLKEKKLKLQLKLKKIKYPEQFMDLIYYLEHNILDKEKDWVKVDPSEKDREIEEHKADGFEVDYEHEASDGKIR